MLIVTVAATVEPVTLTEAKAHLRVTHSSDDTLIGSLITAAREAAEQITGRALAAATYRWASEGEIAAEMRLPLWPVATVTTVSYEDADGVRQTMDSGDYALDGDRAVVALTPPEGGSKLSVTFTVAPTLVPEAVKSAIKLMVEDLYVNTGGVITGETVEQNPAAERILHLQRVNLGL